MQTVDEPKYIREKDYDHTFEEIYGDNIVTVYDQEVVEFFLGYNSFDHRYWERSKDGALVYKGFIWVSRHYATDDPNKLVAETLTVEPLDGNQLEIAVRFPMVEKRGQRSIMAHRKNPDGKGYQTVAHGDAKFSGYRINEWGTMTGVCTNGH